MATIDSYAETNQDAGYNLDSEEFVKTAQSFTGNGSPLNSCKFYLRKSGSPTGNAAAVLYAHTGTYGSSSKPTGAALATSGNLDVSTLTTSYALKEFTFASPYTVVNGTYYCISIEYAGGDGTNFIQAGIDTSSPTHAGNAATYISTWAAAGSTDMIFYCLTAAVDVTVNVGLQAATGAILAATVTGNANVTAGLQAAVAAILSASMTGDANVTLGLLQALATMYSVMVSVPGVGHYMSLSELISRKGEFFNPEGKRLRIHIASKSGKKVNL